MPQAIARPLSGHPLRSFLTVRSAAFAVLIGSCSLAFAAPPSAAPSQPVTETLHGVAVPDPYRNLENSKSPQTRAWLKEQGDYAAAQLAGIEGRDAMAARIEALARASGDVVRGVVRMPGERLYYLKRKAGENQMKLVMRQGRDGAERVLVDPEQMAKASGVPHAVNYFAPSWDGKTLAYGVSAGGSEDASLYLMDVASGKAIGQPISRVPGRLVHWTPDSRSITFNRNRELPKGAPETEVFLDTTVFLLKVGDPASRARPLFGPLVSTALKLDRLDVGEVIFAPGSPWMIARTTDTTVPEGRIYVAPLADLGRKTIAWRQLASAADKITEVKLHGDTVYLRTYAGAPRGKLVSVPAKDPVLARASEIVAEPERGVFLDFQVGRDAVYSEVRQGFNIRTYRHPLGRDAARAQGVDIAPKLAGSTLMTDDPAHAHADMWVVNSTWTDPVRMLQVRADGSTEDTGLLTTTRPPGAPELQVSDVMYPSHDGVMVPLAILHRKGLELDGENPTLLIGYGSYGFAFQAFYDPRSIAWLERGGVIAYANVRGSGAFGDAWHRAGFKATKSNTWKDGVAAARYLIAQKYTSPKKLGIWGTSAGGIFVGRAVTTAPELFAAAIFDVGVMDAVRAEESANGITNTSEFGSWRNPAEFPALLEMSTYHNIKDGTPYPAVMLIHGINDPRVDVWHSAKAAARLQAATTSGKPVLMRLDAQAGHGVGSTAKQGYSKQADAYSFMLDQFSKNSPHKD